ncbi:MAG: hypothetical protein OXI30_01180 [Chloroflexota bacterium]|nr:hypothetical protein [Chloroflexota bacterium]
MESNQLALDTVVMLLSILGSVWWLSRRIGEMASKDDLARHRTELKDDNIRLEESLKADIARVEETANKAYQQAIVNESRLIEMDKRFERVDKRFGRVESKIEQVHQQAVANEAKLLSIGEKSDYIVRQVERIETRQYHQLAGIPEAPTEEES